jgi:hypothetical protein
VHVKFRHGFEKQQRLDDLADRRTGDASEVAAIPTPAVRSCEPVTAPQAVVSRGNNRLCTGRRAGEAQRPPLDDNCGRGDLDSISRQRSDVLEKR